MNIFMRIKNRVIYAHYNRLRKKALDKAGEAWKYDKSEFDKWSHTYVDYAQKCNSIQLH